jgi:transcriptional regulator with GAF, ATPase, and Fis domain
VTDLPTDGPRHLALAATFVALTDTLVTDFDVNDLFDRLVTACIDVLDATTAGLMLVDHSGALQLVASSSEAMRDLELFEMSHGEGPCIDAFATGDAVVVRLSDPGAAQRWPRFATEAAARSLTSVQALPMRLRATRIGALNVFHSAGRDPRPDETRMAQAFADVATIAILQRRALASSEMLAEQLQTALNQRIVIEQVKGLLAERGQLSVDAAFARLRTFCRSRGLPLTKTAREIVNGERDPDSVLQAQ